MMVQEHLYTCRIHQQQNVGGAREREGRLTFTAEGRSCLRMGSWKEGDLGGEGQIGGTMRRLDRFSVTDKFNKIYHISVTTVWRRIVTQSISCFKIGLEHHLTCDIYVVH